MLNALETHSGESNPTSTRYERKFVVPESLRSQFLLKLLTNPSIVRKAYPDRWVQSIYFDDDRLSAYHENVMGSSIRAKFRLRWYGAIDTPLPTKFRLEIKRRAGTVGTKELYYMSDLPAQVISNWRQLRAEIVAALKEERVGCNFKFLSPVLVCSYQRSYYICPQLDLRVTIDRSIGYENYSNFCNRLGQKRLRQKLKSCVIEVKYPIEKNREASKFLQEFNLRLSRNSKYVIGIEELRLDL